jgi:hypothetical protein
MNIYIHVYGIQSPGRLFHLKCQFRPVLSIHFACTYNSERDKEKKCPYSQAEIHIGNPHQKDILSDYPDSKYCMSHNYSREIVCEDWEL